MSTDKVVEELLADIGNVSVNHLILPLPQDVIPIIEIISHVFPIDLRYNGKGVNLEISNMGFYRIMFIGEGSEKLNNIFGMKEKLFNNNKIVYDYGRSTSSPSSCPKLYKISSSTFRFASIFNCLLTVIRNDESRIEGRIILHVDSIEVEIANGSRVYSRMIYKDLNEFDLDAIVLLVKSFKDKYEVGTESLKCSFDIESNYEIAKFSYISPEDGINCNATVPISQLISTPHDNFGEYYLRVCETFDTIIKVMCMTVVTVDDLGNDFVRMTFYKLRALKDIGITDRSQLRELRGVDIDQANSAIYHEIVSFRHLINTTALMFYDIAARARIFMSKLEGVSFDNKTPQTVMSMFGEQSKIGIKRIENPVYHRPLFVKRRKLD